MNDKRVVSVSTVLARIKAILTTTFDFSTVWIQGEVSNLTKHRSGHYYFSLKDEKGEMSCVMFSSYVRHMNFDLKEGMRVLVQGSVNVYEARGSLQLYIKKIQPDGLGDLYLELKQRYKRLKELGYFDLEHKKSKPDWIENVAVITAKEGAALQDVLKTVEKRWPMLKITLYPAYVQGNQAPASLIKQIVKADSNNYDALLIVRGGGSFEDLFCFNDEHLVKTIYECKTYTVSGVGHEVDTTLCDLVCDHRALTPTAAAQWVTPDQEEVKRILSSYEEQMIVSLNHLLDMNRQKLISLEQNPYIEDPYSWIYEKQLKLDSLQTSLEHGIQSYSNKKDKVLYLQDNMIKSISKKMTMVQLHSKMNQQKLQSLVTAFTNHQKNQLVKNISLLDAYSPLKVMARGYAAVFKEKSLIASIDQVDTEDRLQVYLNDGCLNTVVIDKEEKTLWHKKN